MIRNLLALLQHHGLNKKTSTKLIVKAISYNKEYYFLKDLIRAALPVKARK